MTSIVLHSTSGPDGMLRLEVPLGPENANQEFRVVIEALPKRLTSEEAAALLDSVAGKWEGDFERPPQCMRCNDKGTTQP